MVLTSQASLAAYKKGDDSGMNSERQVNAFSPIGLRLGAFSLHPRIAISGQYDTNIHRTDKNSDDISSYVTHFRPGFSLYSNWGQHRLGLNFNADLAVYEQESSRNDYQDIFVKLDGQLNVLRDSYLSANFTYRNLHEDRGSVDEGGVQSPTFYDVKTLDLGYKHKFNRITLEPSFQISRLDYENISLIDPSGTGSLRQESRSRWNLSPTIKIAYAIQPEYSAFAKFTWREYDYDTTTTTRSLLAYDRDSYGYNALAGIEFELTDLVTGDLSIGYLYRDYEDARLSAISSVNGFVNIAWRPTTLTDVNFRLSHDIRETTQNGVSGIVATSGRIGIQHELLRNVVVNAKVSLTYNEYNGFNSNNSDPNNRKDREDFSFNGGVGVKYLLNRHFNIALNYTSRDRDSNYSFGDYNSDQVMFNITAQQ